MKKDEREENPSSILEGIKDFRLMGTRRFLDKEKGTHSYAERSIKVSIVLQLK